MFGKMAIRLHGTSVGDYLTRFYYQTRLIKELLRKGTIE